jgi:acyl-coenzyme A synthetase/AMP-(fatty) acid ligase
VTGVTHENLAAGLAENKAAIEALAAEHHRATEALEKKFSAEMSAMRGDFAKMAEVLETYTAIKKGGKVIEWLSKVIAALLVIVAVAKGGWQFFVEIVRGA